MSSSCICISLVVLLEEVYRACYVEMSGTTVIYTGFGFFSSASFSLLVNRADFHLWVMLKIMKPKCDKMIMKYEKRNTHFDVPGSFFLIPMI